MSYHPDHLVDVSIGVNVNTPPQDRSLWQGLNPELLLGSNLLSHCWPLSLQDLSNPAFFDDITPTGGLSVFKQVTSATNTHCPVTRFVSQEQVMTDVQPMLVNNVPDLQLQHHQQEVNLTTTKRRRLNNTGSSTLPTTPPSHGYYQEPPHELNYHNLNEHVDQYLVVDPEVNFIPVNSNRDSEEEGNSIPNELEALFSTCPLVDETENDNTDHDNADNNNTDNSDEGEVAYDSMESPNPQELDHHNLHEGVNQYLVDDPEVNFVPVNSNEDSEENSNSIPNEIEALLSMDATGDKTENDNADNDDEGEANFEIIEISNPQECEVCKNLFVDETALAIHRQNSHENTNSCANHQDMDDSKQCPICLVFLKAQNLDRHISVVHNTGAAVKCEFCETTFNSRKSLSLHRRQIHGVDSPSVIKKEASRRQANGRSTQKRLFVYKCAMDSACNHQTTTKGNMKRHVTTNHKKLRPFQCQFCDHRSKTKHNNQIHEATHTQDDGRKRKRRRVSNN